MSLMSDGKEMCFKVPPETFRLDGRITQRIRRVPNRRTSDRESAQVPNVLRRNRGIFNLRRLAKQRCWQPETSETVGEVARSSVPQTLITSTHYKHERPLSVTLRDSCQNDILADLGSRPQHTRSRPRT